ncbi:MAG: ParB/RepB/Spo0J family partition protein [Firmicutes bacterium]|nr:ParB/RepB/Spo0J family partition protein [Bacillota bacterium]
MAAKQKKGLGRGLSALFEDFSTNEMENNPKKKSDTSAIAKPETKDKKEPTPKNESPEDFESAVILVDINDIKPNENQPRKNFDAEKISELADSIKEHGIIQPLLLRREKSGYELVAGERRWRAAREAGLKKVPAIVKKLTDQENMLVAIIENMQREDLNPVEEAEGINQMIRTYGLTQEQVSKSLGKSRPYITNALRLLTLPKEALDSLAAGEITSGHARALLSIQNKDRQSAVLRRIIGEGLSVREVERIAQGEKPGNKAHRGRRMEKSRDILAVEQDLKDILGTKVSIVTNGKKGAIAIEYYSVEELNRLIDLIKTIR